MENRILKHRSCEQPEDVAVQFAKLLSVVAQVGVVVAN